MRLVNKKGNEMLKLKSQMAGSLFACFILAGCGGGGSTTPTPAPIVAAAEGVFAGTLTGSRSTAFNLLVLENGDFWTLYGTQSATLFSVAGIVQGTGTSNNGSFTSSNVKDFGQNPAVNATLSATYSPTAQTISGTVSSSSGNVGFSGGPLTNSTYNYATPAVLSSIAGSWSVTSTSGETISINISNSGVTTGTGSSGCNFSGTVTTRPSGKNVFNTTLTFGPAPCGLPNQSASGIAVVYPLTSGRTQVVFAQVDSTRSYGSAAFGTR